MDSIRVKVREILKDIEDQIDKDIDEEDTRNAVNTLEGYFENVDRVVDLNEKEVIVETITP